MAIAHKIGEVQGSFKEFVEQYPEIANLLSLQDSSPDPDVQYLLDAFASIESKLSQQLDSVRAHYAQTLMHESRCAWLNPVPPAVPLHLSPANTNNQTWPIRLTPGTMFANGTYSVRTFGHGEVWPWSVQHVRYNKGADCHMHHDILLDVSILAERSATWRTPNGIRLFFPAKFHGERLVSEILLAQKPALCIFGTQKKFCKIGLGNINTPLIDADCEPGDLRLQELLSNLEKYLFLDIDLKEWSGQALQLFLPIYSSWQSTLPLIDTVRCYTNCMVGSMVEKRVMDPMRHNGITSSYPVLWSGNDHLCGVANIKADEQPLSGFRTYEIAGHHHIHLPPHTPPSTIYGELWVVPKHKLHIDVRLECPERQVIATTLASAHGIYRPSKDFVAEVWASYITSDGNPGGDLIQHILKTVPHITNNRIAGLISKLKYSEQQFVAVSYDHGWAWGTYVTLCTDQFTPELGLIGYILLEVLRAKARINYVVGLKILNLSGQQMVAWPPEITHTSSSTHDISNATIT
jgi:hypothetical protein